VFIIHFQQFITDSRIIFEDNCQVSVKIASQREQPQAYPCVRKLSKVLPETQKMVNGTHMHTANIFYLYSTMKLIMINY
jgi:hypothetical protein